MAMTKSTLAVYLLLLGTYQTAQAQTAWGVVNTFQIGDQGAWDYLTPAPETHRLYVPRTTHTMVIDSESGKTIADIPGQQAAHGVALAPAAGRGFISDGGGDGAVIIFDLKTNAVLGSLKALPDTDGIIYDPFSKQVLVVSGRGKALMTFKPDIDPKNGRIEEPIPLHGEPEFLTADPGGRAYVNLMTTNEVAAIDLKTRKVLANWPVAPGGAPVGMAIDTTNGRIFIGCRNPQKLIVMSTRNGEVLADLPIGPTVDAVKFLDGQAFATTGDSQLSVAAETAPGKFAIVQTVKTGEGARTMALDPTARRIFLPGAEYEIGANNRRVQKPDTFKLLVVAPQAAK
jgi:DNA-binding beta-propeller fold protein YncE